ncbi:hypothetical protein [Methylobacterium sp. SyP6R]|uniref:hypothetical protein n=1 Tax=Methylobacterium sp. SyP6R TaxID=2718876 RepID=UPI001F2DFC59|nr:hypothetical protein [Methylobacterium sp. SyP6R]MCF4125227.1 hypothetical protein [Methylobacterium sp. SyP6R]
MTKTTLLLAGAALLAATAAPVQPAQAQSVRENYTYKAPSGMFSEGTTKWDMYRFMAIDHEEHEKQEAAARAVDQTAVDQTAAVPTAHTRLHRAH